MLKLTVTISKLGKDCAALEFDYDHGDSVHLARVTLTRAGWEALKPKLDRAFAALLYTERVELPNDDQPTEGKPS